MKQKSKLIVQIILLILYVALLGIYWPLSRKAANQHVVRSKALMSQAERQIDRGDYKDAEGTYKDLIKKKDGSRDGVQAQFALAELYEKKIRNKHNALATYREIVKEDKNVTITITRGGKKEEVKAVPEANAQAKRLANNIDKDNSSYISYKLIDFLVKMTGSDPRYSYFLAILILTLVIKAITTPLTKKQFKSMAEMQKLQPKMKELQEKYKDKPDELNKRMLGIYKENGVNPASGCLPMLIQMPILFWLYGVIRLYEFQFAKANFLWISNLSQPDIPLLLLYAVSMYFSMKLTSMPSPDPSQQQQQKIMAIGMPVMFTFVVKTMPSAFVLYWFTFNIFSTWQTYHIMREHRTEQPEKVTVGAVEKANDKKKKS